MSKGHSLQDPYLNVLRKERVPVSIYLVNGIKLQGQIESFDQFVILLKNTVSQMVYKHAISTVVPGRPVRLPVPGADEGDADNSWARGSPDCFLNVMRGVSGRYSFTWKARTSRVVNTLMSFSSWCARQEPKWSSS